MYTVHVYMSASLIRLIIIILICIYFNYVNHNTGNKTQVEIEEVDMTGNELMTNLASSARIGLSHFWDKNWDYQHRQRVHSLFENDTLEIWTDFSAVYDCGHQHQANCFMPEHSIQAVFFVSHSPRWVQLEGGGWKRITTNDAWHFWGKTTKTGRNAKLTSNNFFHMKCLIHIIEYYRADLKEDFFHVIIYTDGCAEQYKSRRNYWAIKMLQLYFKLLSVVHNYVPSACFKSVVDGLGGDTKVFMNKVEKREKDHTRSYNARRVFETLRRDMPQPKEAKTATKKDFQIDRRFQRFLVDKTESKHDGTYASDVAAADIIVVDCDNEYWDCASINGINANYQVAAFAVIGEETVVHTRAHACFCTCCMKQDYAACTYQHETGPWKKVKMKKKEYVPTSPLPPTISEIVTFLKSAGIQDEVNPEPIFVAVRVAEVGTDDETNSFQIAIVEKGPKSKKTVLKVRINDLLDVEGNAVTGVFYDIPANTPFISVTYLTCVDEVDNVYCVRVTGNDPERQFIPVKTIIPPPVTQLGATRFNYLKCDRKFTDPQNAGLECFHMATESITWIMDALTDSMIAGTGE
jgi:hypothetical protein